MFNRNRGKLGSNSSLEDAWEEYQKRPDAVLDNASRIRSLAMAVRDVVRSQGWQDVVGPFIDRAGDPAILLGCMSKENPGEVFLKTAPTVLAFQKIKRFMERLADEADKILQMEAAAREKKEDDDEGEDDLS